jgi:hypothetical protein
MRSVFARLGVSVLVALAGCGAPPPPPPLVEREWTADELLRAVRGRTEDLSTLRAGLELVWPDPDTGESKSCGGNLSWARPTRLRVRGTTKAFFTVFDLVAAPDLVWLDVPREDFVVFGSRDDPAWDELPLSPDALLIALLADPCVPDTCLGEVELGEGTDEIRMLVGGGWTLALDRGTGLPVFYERSEGDRLRITWDEWRVRHGTAWPGRIWIRVGEETRELEVRLGRLQPDREIRETTFFLEPEDDREILTPSDALERWERIRL